MDKPTDTPLIEELANQPLESENEVFTGIVSSAVKPEYQADYEAWIKNISQAARQFEGFLGINILRPPSGAAPEYVVVFKFKGYANLKAWMNSEIRQNFIESSKPFLARESQVQVLNGMESWFTLNPKTVKAPPPKYKMAMILWLAVSSLLLIIPPAMTWLLGPFLPKLVLQLVTSAIMVTLMTYYVMPFLTKVFAKWLAG